MRAAREIAEQQVATKYTAGPWRKRSVDKNDGGLIYWRIEAGGDCIGLAGVYYAKRDGAPKTEKLSEATATANADLICAAPAMHEALRDAAEFLLNGTPIHPGPDVAEAILTAARAVR